jgi:lipopolysaccharide export system permease protein
MLPGTILNRLIFGELVKVFLLSLGTVTGLLVTGLLTQEALKMGLSLSQIVRAIPLFVPNALPYTIPATTLFAACVVYGRLAHDNEVVAIKGAGVHLLTVLKPAVLLGLLAAGTTAALYHTVIPTAQKLLYRQLLEDPEELLYAALRRDRCLRHPNSEYAIYVREVQGKRLLDVVIKKRTRVKNPETGKDSFVGYGAIARTREARLRVELAEGKLYIDPPAGFVIYDKNTSGATASTGPIPMDLPEGFNGKDNKLRVSALTWDEIPERLAELRDDLAEAEGRRAENRRKALGIENPDLRRLVLEQDQHFEFEVKGIRRTIRNTEAEWYQRPALAAGCLLFALLGCPVGIWANRADYLSTFVVCFLPALFVYYPLFLAGTGMGKDGKLPLGLGCWLANIAVGVVAVVLNWRLLRR